MERSYGFPSNFFLQRIFFYRPYLRKHLSWSKTWRKSIALLHHPRRVTHKPKTCRGHYFDFSWLLDPFIFNATTFLLFLVKFLWLTPFKGFKKDDEVIYGWPLMHIMLHLIQMMMRIVCNVVLCTKSFFISVAMSYLY